jgi:hypothetical protein
MAKKTYIAKTAIEHNKEAYTEGEELSLDDKTEAPALLAVKAIEEAPEKAPEKTAEAKKAGK